MARAELDERSRAATRERAPGAVLATAAFILSFFVFEYHPLSGDVPLPVHYLEWLALLIASFMALGRVAPRFLPVLVVLIALVFAILPNVLLNSRRFGDGPASSYEMAAFQSGLYILIAALVAFVFYDEELFLKLWKRIASGAAMIAVIGFSLAYLGSTPVLAQFSGNAGGWRLTGLLSEASAWAPIVPGILFLGIRNRNYFMILLALGCLVLSRSPTVMLTTLIAGGLVLILKPGRTANKLGIGALVALLVTQMLPRLQDEALARSLLSAENPAQVALGRLVAGFQYIDTEGATGQNVRYDGVTDTIAAAVANGWDLVGRGLGSSQVYFPNVDGVQKAFNYPVQVFFDTGFIGLVIVVSLAAVAVFRMRNREASLVFIPFFVASLINIAQGVANTKFIWLAIFVYVFSEVGAQVRRNSRGGSPVESEGEFQSV